MTSVGNGSGTAGEIDAVSGDMVFHKHVGIFPERNTGRVFEVVEKESGNFTEMRLMAGTEAFGDFEAVFLAQTFKADPREALFFPGKKLVDRGGMFGSDTVMGDDIDFGAEEFSLALACFDARFRTAENGEVAISLPWASLVSPGDVEIDMDAAKEIGDQGIAVI